MAQHQPDMNNPWIMTAHGSSAAYNAAEVRRALAILLDPTAVHEIRGLPSARLRLIRGNALDDAVKAVAELADDKGVYFTINPCDANALAGRHTERRGARNRDILARRLLYIDVDPTRAKGVNATEAERSAAQAVAEAVMAELDAAGWPRPVVIDSGSGWHLHYAVDLPNDPLTQQIISKFIRALKSRHDTDAASVDPTVHNASRIARLPGTWNRKGPVSTPDRPYRLCRLVSVPQSIVAVGIEELKAAAGIADDGEAEGHPADPAIASLNPWLMRADDRSDSYAKSAMEREVGKVATAADLRNNTLHIAAVSLGTLIGAGRLDESEVRDKLERAARAAGLGSDGDPEEIARAINNGLEFGKQHPRQDQGGKSEHKASSEAPVDNDTGKRSYAFPLVVKASAIKPKKVRWLWPDRVPFGFLTLFAGRTSVGKSFVTLDLAARLTTGSDLPFSGGECPDPGNVLIISEDSPEYVLTPRLIELEADLDRVNFMGWEAMGAWSMADLDMLDDAYRDSGEPRLVVVDPPTNFLGQRDEHKNAEVRGVLMGLSLWAMRHDVAVLLITHCNKGVKKEIAALDRIIGSVAWASTSRIAHLLAPDPDDPTRCLFIPLKCNIGKVARGLSYRIKETDTLAVVEWLEEVDATGDDALAGTIKPRRVVASEWLIERFRERREWRSDDLFDAAKESGVSRNAVFEAKQLLDLPSAKVITALGGQKTYVWWVPKDWPLLEAEGAE